MSNPNKLHYPRGYTSVAGITFNPKFVVGAILVVFSLYAVYKYGQFAAEKSFNMTLDDSGKGVRSVELLSWNPRVFYHRNFLTESETSTLMASAFNSSTEDTVTSKPFNSNSAWYEDLLKRIARFTQEPPGNYELGIFSKYSVGAEMEARRDWFKNDEAELMGPRGNRVATLLMFLTNSGGGEVVLPQANIKVTPQVGDALLIWNLTPDHKIDQNTIYGIQKVAKTPLITFTIYIRERS